MRADPSLCFLAKVGLPNNLNDSTAGEPTDPDDRQVVFFVLINEKETGISILWTVYLVLQSLCLCNMDTSNSVAVVPLKQIGST